MFVSFSCDCGHRLKAAVDCSGKRTRCPGCGAVLVVPGSLRNAGQGDLVTDRDIARHLETSAPSPSRPRKEDLNGPALDSPQPRNLYGRTGPTVTGATRTPGRIVVVCVGVLALVCMGLAAWSSYVKATRSSPHSGEFGDGAQASVPTSDGVGPSSETRRPGAGSGSNKPGFARAARTFESGSDHEIEALLVEGGSYWSSPVVNDFVPSDHVSERNGDAIRAGKGYWIWPVPDGASLTAEGEAEFTLGWRTRAGQSPHRAGSTPPQARLVSRLVSSTSMQSSASFTGRSLDEGKHQGTFKLSTGALQSGALALDVLAFLETEPEGRSNLIAMSFFVDATNRTLIPRGKPHGAHVLDERVRLERRSITHHTTKIRGEPHDVFVIRLGLAQLPRRSAAPITQDVAVWSILGSRNISAQDTTGFMDFLGALVRPGESGTLQLEESWLGGRFKRGSMTLRGTPKDQRFSHMKDLTVSSDVVAPDTLSKAWRLDAGEIAFPVSTVSVNDEGAGVTSFDGRYVGVALVAFDGPAHRLLSSPLVIDLGAERRSVASSGRPGVTPARLNPPVSPSLPLRVGAEGWTVTEDCTLNLGAEPYIRQIGGRRFIFADFVSITPMKGNRWSYKIQPTADSPKDGITDAFGQRREKPKVKLNSGQIPLPNTLGLQTNEVFIIGGGDEGRTLGGEVTTGLVKAGTLIMPPQEAVLVDTEGNIVRPSDVADASDSR